MRHCPALPVEHSRVGRLHASFSGLSLLGEIADNGGRSLGVIAGRCPWQTLRIARAELADPRSIIVYFSRAEDAWTHKIVIETTRTPCLRSFQIVSYFFLPSVAYLCTHVVRSLQSRHLHRSELVPVSVRTASAVTASNFFLLLTDVGSSSSTSRGR